MRKSFFSGSFYSNNCNELTVFFNSKKSKNRNKVIRAIVVPHAGYFYSGNVALEVYKLPTPRSRSISSSYPSQEGNSRIYGEKYKRIIVVGPSHHIYFKNASVALEENYQTPCGNLDIDVQYSYELIEKFDFLSYIKQAHREHSTEVQMPFIKHFFKDVKVIEIVYGDINSEKLALLMKEILENKDNLLVVSTDLSHFYTLDEANRIDLNCINAFKELDIKELQNCEACGLTGLKALIKVSKESNLKSKLVSYKTSADASGDKSRVVGYMSGIITE